MVGTEVFPLSYNYFETAQDDCAAAASDLELARRAGRGDIDSFEEIYRRHHRRVYSLCLKMTREVETAEDLAQEVFIQLYDRVGSFRGDSAFTTWLHRLTVNHVLMYFRRPYTKRKQSIEETPKTVLTDAETYNDVLMLDRLALDAAIADLSPGYRIVFVLHDIEGYDHHEIARMLGIAVGTSKSQLHKARMKLRGKLLPKRSLPQRSLASDRNRAPG